MKDYITIGSTPYGEECAQAGSDNYHEQSRIETKAFLEQIRRVVGQEPFGARLVVKSFPHDFGSYSEVCVVFNDEDESAVNYAYYAEGHAGLEFWDDMARNFLKSSGYEHIGASQSAA